MICGKNCHFWTLQFKKKKKVIRAIPERRWFSSLNTFLTCVRNWSPLTCPLLCGHSGNLLNPNTQLFLQKCLWSTKPSDFTFVRICLFFHNCKRLQQKCFDPPADWISAANWGTLLGDVSSSLLKGEQPIRLWWRIRLFFPVQKIQKTHPNCIWMQRAASPRSQREKNHQVFFFYFHFAFGFSFFFFFFENLQSGVSYLLSGCLTSKM